MATKTPTRKKLDRTAVLARIEEILSAGAPDAESLLAFAELINGKPFPEPVITLTELKASVCKVFGSNGVDVLENFRPWHVFSLDPSTASAEDIKEAFRRLAKEHHPDVGGDPRVMERLQKMRDSLLAFL